jgi:AcrR family transcriptional regulator
MGADGEGTKDRLRTEARDLYLEEGFAHFSLREVARRAGVSAAAVYRHYDGKEALFAEVCMAGLQLFYTYLVRAMGEPTPRSRLTATATQYLRFATENPRDYRVLFMGEPQELAVGKAAKQGPDPTFQFLIDRIRECMHARILQEGDALEVATIIWAHVHGLVSLRLSGHLSSAGDDGEFARFYERATEHLLSGLAA